MFADRGYRLRVSPRPYSKDRQENDASLRRMYSQMNGQYFDASGRAVPLLALRGRTDLVALTPQEVGTLFEGLNRDLTKVPLEVPGMKRPLLVPKYLPLQQHLLQSRVFIVHDPQPEQPQLPLDLSGTSIRLPLPSAN